MSHEQQLGATGNVRGSSERQIGAFARSAIARVSVLPLIIYAVFALLLGLPLLLVLVQAVMPSLFDVNAPDMALSLGPLEKAFGSLRVGNAVVNSLELAATTALTATLLGGAFALLAHGSNIPARRFIATVPWLVFLTPSYL